MEDETQEAESEGHHQHQPYLDYRAIHRVVKRIDPGIDFAQTDFQPILDSIEAAIDFVEAPVHLVEAPVHLVEAPVHVPGEIIQAIVGPAVPHRLHDCTLNVAGARVAHGTENFQQRINARSTWGARHPCEHRES